MVSNVLRALAAQDASDIRRHVGPARCLGCNALVPPRAEPPPEIPRPTLFGLRPEECPQYFAFTGREKDKVHDMGWMFVTLQRGHFKTVGGWVCPECWQGEIARADTLEGWLERPVGISDIGECEDFGRVDFDEGVYKSGLGDGG